MKVIFKAYIRNVLNKIKNQHVSVIFSGVMSLGSKHYIGNCFVSFHAYISCQILMKFISKVYLNNILMISKISVDQVFLQELCPIEILLISNIVL